MKILIPESPAERPYDLCHAAILHVKAMKKSEFTVLFGKPDRKKEPGCFHPAFVHFIMTFL